MPQSPVNAKTDLITFTVLAGGSKISDTYEILSIHTSKFVNRQPFANIVLLDGSAATSDFEVSNKADFLPGVEIEIKAGYHSKETTIFKGIITKHAVTATSDISELRLECRDKSIKMIASRKNTYFLEKLDSDIIKTLIGNAGASAEVEATTYEHKCMIQFNVSDCGFATKKWTYS